MLFPTPEFAGFFIAVFALAWALRNIAVPRKLMLLAASYIFYGYWDWRFCGLLAASSTIAWVGGLSIARGNSERERRLAVAIAIALNLSILGFFKYYGFFLQSLADLLARLGLERDLPFLEIILPVGISFFTFQAMSYIIDVYRGQARPVRNPVDLFLYISFFPQLVAGPIVRAKHFLPQLDNAPKLTRTRSGVCRSGLLFQPGSVIRGLWLCGPDLLRLFRLLRYRDRCRRASGLPLPAKFRSALSSTVTS
jgi:D-alanyl-lipoteichoic acid acyltransferase DltB (MBOAT superfamily)